MTVFDLMLGSSSEHLSGDAQLDLKSTSQCGSVGKQININVTLTLQK